MTITAGLLLGVLSSLHCVTMCGPLLLTLATSSADRPMVARIAHIGWYHAGRITTYAVLGSIAGLAGSLVAVAGAGRALAIAAGVLLVISSITPAATKRWQLGLDPWLKFVGRAGAAARRWQLGHPVAGPLAAGMVNGLLPCGMVYAAVATALAAGSIEQAMLTMLAFGLGTTPALAAVSLTAAQFSPTWRRRLAHVAPACVAIVGILLILRGVATPGSPGLPAPHHHAVHSPK
jgi:sulfite exporter TauE/SafE